MNTLYISRGLPASGKSTWAQGVFDRLFPAVMWLERDRLRDAFFNTRRNKSYFTCGEHERSVTQAISYMLLHAKALGYDVICSDTNLNDKTFNGLLAQARNLGMDVEVNDSFLQVPIEECIRRDKDRAFPVGETVIRRMATKNPNILCQGHNK